MAKKRSGFVVDAEVIQRSPLGRELSLKQCRKLAAVVSARSLKKGAFLLEEGHKDADLHVVSRGELEVVKRVGGDEWVTLQVLRPGDMAGELGFLDDVEHSAGIRALGDTEVFSLSRPHLEKLLARDPELVYQVMRAIIRAVHGILGRMNLQFVEMTNYIIKQHGRY